LNDNILKKVVIYNAAIFLIALAYYFIVRTSMIDYYHRDVGSLQVAIAFFIIAAFIVNVQIYWTSRSLSKRSKLLPE
jgi:hypothetical protein